VLAVKLLIDAFSQFEYLSGCCLRAAQFNYPVLKGAEKKGN
jgi:hypothetical protein